MHGLIVKRIIGAVALVLGLALAGRYVYFQFFPTPAFEQQESIYQLVFPLLLAIFGWRWLRSKGQGIQDITPPDFSSPELEASKEAARKSLPTFLDEVDKGIDGAFIKFPLKTPQELTEHIWAYVHFYRDGVFNVSLANDPYDREQESDGRMNVPVEQVEDWQIMHRDGSIQGAHSLIALFRYHEGRGVKLTPMMKEQKAQLLDA